VVREGALQQLFEENLVGHAGREEKPLSIRTRREKSYTNLV